MKKTNQNEISKKRVYIASGRLNDVAASHTFCAHIFRHAFNASLTSTRNLINSNQKLKLNYLLQLSYYSLRNPFLSSLSFFISSTKIKCCVAFSRTTHTHTHAHSSRKKFTQFTHAFNLFFTLALNSLK